VGGEFSAKRLQGFTLDLSEHCSKSAAAHRLQWLSDCRQPGDRVFGLIRPVKSDHTLFFGDDDVSGPRSGQHSESDSVTGCEDCCRWSPQAEQRDQSGASMFSRELA